MPNHFVISLHKDEQILPLAFKELLFQKNVIFTTNEGVILTLNSDKHRPNFLHTMSSILLYLLRHIFASIYLNLAFVSSPFIYVFTCYDFNFQLCILTFRLLSWCILLLFMYSSTTCYFYLGLSHFLFKPFTCSSFVHDFRIHEFDLRGVFSCLSFFFSCVPRSWFLTKLYWLTEP